MSCYYNFRAIHHKLFSDFSKFLFPLWTSNFLTSMSLNFSLDIFC